MLYLILIGAGFLLGAVIGRWWTVVAAIGLGVWIAVEEEVEVPGWFLGLGYGGLAALGIAAGILLRNRLASRDR